MTETPNNNGEQDLNKVKTGDEIQLTSKDLIEKYKDKGLNSSEIQNILDQMENEMKAIDEKDIENKEKIKQKTKDELRDNILQVIREQFSDKVGEFQNEAFGSGVKSVDFDEKGVFFDHDALSNQSLVDLMNAFDLSQDEIIDKLNEDRNLNQKVRVNEISEADNTVVNEGNEEEKSELDKLLDKRNDLLALKGKEVFLMPMNKVGAEALLHFSKVSEGLQGDLRSNYNALSKFVLNTNYNVNASDLSNFFHDNQGTLESQINTLELSLSAYDAEVKLLNNDAQVQDIPEIKPEPIINQAPEQSEIVTNFSNIVDSVNPFKGVEIKLVDGVCHLKYTKTGNTTKFTLSENDNAKYLSEEGLKLLVEEKLKQWNKTPEVNPVQDNEGQDNEGQDNEEQDNEEQDNEEQDNEEQDGSIIDNVSENISNGVDYIVEKTKDLIDWADELVDGNKVGSFTGANGEKVQIQCDGEKLSIDTSWFGDDIEDYYITQTMSDIVNQDGELIQKTINDLISEYNQKVLEEAYDDINKNSRTSDVVDTLTNADGETEKVYLKRRDTKDGEIKIFVQIGDEKSYIELKDNTYTHSQIENKIKEAKALYNTQVEEKVSIQAKELTEINKEIGGLNIEKSVKELIDHKVGNKNFKTIELGTVDEKGDSIDVTLRKYPDGSYRVMIDPDGFGNGESIKLEKNKFNKNNVEDTIKKLVAKFRIEK